MVEQFSENQYDDDLTVGANEFDDFSGSGTVDLFEFSTQEESPINRLKSLILSIDWEITDDILIEFNEELVDLQDVWAEEKINLVYLQALGKISKYIYQHKANSHPNAIKLLLILYYNLEKIVSSENLTAKQQQDILLEDVKRFENLKRQIAQQAPTDTVLLDGDNERDSLAIEPKRERELLQLKATVLGIDWEITEQDLNDLHQEVNRLEEKYAESRPRLILLQGIGTLGAYIKAKKSNAHGDAFKLLHLFFESLENIVKTPMNLEEEKAILFPAVEKFHSFKSLLDSLNSSDSDGDPDDQADYVKPAFANIPEESVRGFQEDEEARRLGSGRSADVASHIDTFFGDDTEDSGDAKAGDVKQVAIGVGLGEDEVVESDGVITPERELALEGVDVETEADEDSDEEALPVEDSGKLAPALAFGDDEEESTYSADSLGDPSLEEGVGKQVAETLDDFFDDEQDSVEKLPKSEVDLEEQIDPVLDDVVAEPEPVFSLERELALEGVEVETEADEDSEEEELPVGESGELAPALSFGDSDGTSAYSADSLGDPSLEEGVGEQIAETLDDFFVDEQQISGVDAVVVEEEQAEVLLDSSAEDEQLADPIVVEEEQSDILPAENELADTVEIFEEPEVIEEITEDEISPEVDEDFVALLAAQRGAQGSGEDESRLSVDETNPVEDPADEEVVFELVTSAGDDEHDSMSALAGYIDSIGSELSDELIGGLYSEIDQLHHKWTANSLEKSFVQILATVVKYIDQNRFESDPESYGLLKSNYDALGSLEEGMVEQNQELLFDEMSKVLQWQQNLLMQQTGTKE